LPPAAASTVNPPGRETECADPTGVDPRPSFPLAQHLVDQHRQLAGAVDDVCGPALIAPVVARVGQGRDDEARPGEGLGRVPVTAKITAIAVRDDDQRARRLGRPGGPPDAGLDRGLVAVGHAQAGPGDTVRHRRTGQQRSGHGRLQAPASAGEGAPAQGVSSMQAAAITEAVDIGQDFRCERAIPSCDAGQPLNAS